MWIKTYRYLVCMKDPLLINASSPKHINQDKSRRKSNDKDSTVNKTEYQSKRNPTGKPWWARQTAKASGPYLLINRYYFQFYKVPYGVYSPKLKLGENPNGEKPCKGFLAHLSYCDHWMSVVRRVSPVVNNCFKGHFLLNYWLDFDQTW